MKSPWRPRHRSVMVRTSRARSCRARRPACAEKTGMCWSVIAARNGAQLCGRDWARRGHRLKLSSLLEDQASAILSYEISSRTVLW